MKANRQWPQKPTQAEHFPIVEKEAIEEKLIMYLMTVYALYRLHKRLGHAEFSNYFFGLYRNGFELIS